MSKNYFARIALGMLVLVFLSPGAVPATADMMQGENNPGAMMNAKNDLNASMTAKETGYSEDRVNNAKSESTTVYAGNGTLIEIGNTTAEQTTIVVRQKKDDGSTQDLTLEITEDTLIQTNSRRDADLSDWIAGDALSFNALKYTNSSQLVTRVIVNHSFALRHKGFNGWITAIRAAKNKIDVQWQNKTYTLSLAQAKLVAGLKNPATITDLKVGDRIRARVVEDNDGNDLTWNAEILVVLRRGETLFMRVTRFVAEAKIIALPQNTTLPTTMQVEILATKFYEKNDVNNLLGKPGDRLYVDILESTNLVRKFLGAALLKEFSEGDTVRIVGRLDEQTGHLVAFVIKDENVQMIDVTQLFGEITAVNAVDKSLSLTLKQTSRTDVSWTIKVNSETKIYKDGKEAVFGDLMTGNEIRVRGTADITTHTLTATMISVASQNNLPDVVEKVREHLRGLGKVLQ